MELKNLKLNIAKDEATYNQFVDAVYRKQYDYEASKSSLPWLIVSFERPSQEDKTPISLKIKQSKSDEYINFGGTSSNVGTVSEDGKTLEITASKYVMFELKNDLGQTGNETNYDAEVVYNNKKQIASTRELPTSSSTLPVTINANEYYDFEISTNPGGFEGEMINILGTVTNADNLELEYLEGDTYKKLEVDGSGTFRFGAPTTGFPLTNATTKLRLKVTADDTYTITTQIVKVPGDYIITESVAQTTVNPQVNSYLTVTAGKNCDGATLTIDDVPAEFGTKVKKAIGTEVTVKVTKTGYVNYVQKVTIEKEEKTLTVDLEIQKFIVTINSKTPETASVTVNDVAYTGPVKFDYGTKVTIKATNENYENFEQVIDSLTKNENVDIVMTSLQQTITVNPTPADATVKINGTEQKTLTVNRGSSVEIEVSKEHYLTHKETVEMTEDVVKDITLELEEHTLTISTVPADAKVTMRNKQTEVEATEQREGKYKYGSIVVVEVSAEGYQTLSKEITVDSDKTENIELEKQKVNVTIKTKTTGLLSNATIKVGNAIAKQDVPVKVIYGETVTITVTQEGFKSFETTITPTKDTEVMVNGNGEWKKPTVTVTTRNSENTSVQGAVIKVNNKVVSEGVAIEVDYNSNVTITVSADGYNDYTETKLITENYQCIANMTKQSVMNYLVKITTIPENATVKLNGGEVKELSVEDGTSVTVEVSAEGYETHTETIQVNGADVTKEITLTKKQFTLTVNTIPVDATVKINGTEQRTITADYQTQVTVEVSKEDFETKTQKYTITKDETVNVTLSESGDTPDPSGEITFEDIKAMLAEKANYSYLNCSRFFKEGVTEETVKNFYMEFGSYVMSKFDYRLWRAMHEFFGHVEGIPEPEPEDEMSKPILPEVDFTPEDQNVINEDEVENQ